MKITTTLAAALAFATLAACTGGGEQNNVENVDANMMMTDNLGATDMNMDMNADMNTGMNTDMNADMNATGNTDMNATNTL